MGFQVGEAMERNTSMAAMRHRRVQASAGSMEPEPSTISVRAARCWGLRVPVSVRIWDWTAAPRVARLPHHSTGSMMPQLSWREAAA